LGGTRKTGGVVFPLSAVMSPSEAAERWGMKRNTIIAALNRGQFDKQIEKGLVRKYVKENGQTEWYLTEQAMIEKYGKSRLA
jgi:ethanolamine utilization protein EutQ (cupin superfamily)